MQHVNFDDFGCSTSTSSDFAEMLQNQAKKLDLAERIRMHRSRASGASNLSRYGLFCVALWCTLFLLVNALERFIMAHGQLIDSLMNCFFLVQTIKLKRFGVANRQILVILMKFFKTMLKSWISPRGLGCNRMHRSRASALQTC